ncbi:MAG: alpha/beta hydrolase [Firmicutes bacterium]|nr:alpha/beta hydrolase [Bacillota bacterium]
MSLNSLLFNLRARTTDYLRDKDIPLPQGITQCRNIAYLSHSHPNRLDVYYPDRTTSPLPTIVSIHGGGYVYGSKEVYRRYCMDLARRGFAVVNFNYRLAPKWKFPTPLEDTNAVLNWVCANARRYYLDPQCVFLVGDSAGAQLASQYAAIWANPRYAAHFSFVLPDVRIRAVGLNCGMYDLAGLSAAPKQGLFRDYLGRDISGDDPRLAVLGAIDSDYPPAHITTACHDFLRENARPMYALLTGKGVPAQLRCYGSEEKKEIAHCFHVNLALPEAAVCNDEQCAFFRQYVTGKHAK